MMPICDEPGCRRTAVKVVGGIIDDEASDYCGKHIFSDLYMCSRHALKFIKKYGGEK